MKLKLILFTNVSRSGHTYIHTYTLVVVIVENRKYNYFVCVCVMGGGSISKVGKKDHYSLYLVSGKSSEVSMRTRAREHNSQTIYPARKASERYNNYIHIIRTW